MKLAVWKSPATVAVTTNGLPRMMSARTAVDMQLFGTHVRSAVKRARGVDGGKGHVEVTLGIAHPERSCAGSGVLVVDGANRANPFSLRCTTGVSPRTK